MTGNSMVRDLNGKRVIFLRFHNADYIILEENGEERVLHKAEWKSLADWTDSEQLDDLPMQVSNH